MEEVGQVDFIFNQKMAETELTTLRHKALDASFVEDSLVQNLVKNPS